jgi:hypothetical protein
MGLGGFEQPQHAFGRGEIEEVLRNIGPGRRGPATQIERPLVETEQTEDRINCVEGLRRLADRFGCAFGGRQRVARLAG